MPQGNAIVIGGSVAGLLAARVLTDHFARVDIIERDVDFARRPGVPHARHLHVLLRRGMEACEALLPGLRDELIARGALAIRQGVDFRVRFRSGWAAATPRGLELVSMTRGLFESALRARVTALPGVAVVSGVRADGLVADAGAIAGVRAGRDVLAADFVVDASGRGSHAPRWLDELGFGAPPESIVDAHWGYAMRIYRRPSPGPAWKQMLVLNRPPDQTRVGVVQPIEDGRWLLNIAGVMNDHPPTDEAGFLEFVRSLPSGELYAAIRDAEPVSPIYGFRHTANQLRRFERMRRWPARFVVAGDALCAFNPVYGQGMTVAALEAHALGDVLARTSPARAARAFVKRAARIVAGPWMLATSEDARWPGTSGAVDSRRVRLLHAYLDRVIDALPSSPEVYARFQGVQHMVRSPLALFHPAVLWRVLRSSTGIANAGAEPGLT